MSKMYFIGYGGNNFINSTLIINSRTIRIEKVIKTRDVVFNENVIYKDGDATQFTSLV